MLFEEVLARSRNLIFSFKEHDDQFQTIHILDLFHSKARTENNQYDIVYRLLFDNDYQRLLSEAGFSKVSIYGAYDMSEYDKNSRRLIVVGENGEQQ